MDRLGMMEVFVLAVETGSFSAVARRLGLGQPTVSRLIAQLEEHLGSRLLLRSTRGLTPTEAERLQGFEPGYTAIPWRGKPADQCPDGPRYKALGNSWAVPNVRWIGQRIQRHLAGEL